MNIFGDFYNRAYSFRQSQHERSVARSEDWAGAVLSGSDQSTQLEDGISAGYMKLFFIAVVVGIVILVAQLFYVQITRGRQNLMLANGNRIRQTTIRAPRGTIYDRDKNVLARNLANFDLVVNPSQLPTKAADRNAVFAGVAKLTKLTPTGVQQKAESKGKYFPQNVLVASNLDRDTALNIEEKSHTITGFSVDINPSREYLDNSTFSHFLGYTGRISPEEWLVHPTYQQTDYIGKTGLEQSYEQDLKGTDGHQQTEVDVAGRPIRELASSSAVPGNNLVLALDGKLEQKMAQALKSGIDAAGAQRGVAIAMDPNNGQILGAVNYPSYDNNLFAKGISQADYKKLLADPGNPLFNKAVQGGYPIGSTIKPLISLAALQEGVINATTTVEDKGKLEVPNIYNPSIVYTFNGWKLEGLGIVNVAKALSWSSDIFYYVVGGGYKEFRGLGIDRLLGWYKKFGLGTKTGIDIKNESAGILPNPSDKKAQTGETWSVGDTYNISIGQGNLQATPMQLIAAISSVANGGTIYKPRLVKQIVDGQGKVVREVKPEVVLQNFVDPKNIALVQDGMKRVVSEGTACCRIKQEVPVTVAGKTGTAETSSAGFDGKNARTKPHAWFVSYAPAEQPQIAMVVLIENSGEGAEYAAPVTREILKWYFGGRL